MPHAYEGQQGSAGSIAELKQMEDRLFSIIMDRLDRIERLQDASATSRAGLHEKLGMTDRAIDRLSGKVEGLERTLTQVTPTITEFMAIKHQVVGAGRFGRALWWLGGLVLTAAASVVSYIWGAKG